MSKCNHKLGSMYGEECTIKGIKEQIIKHVEVSSDFYAMGISSNVVTAKDILDNRKGHMYRYNYCPYCGEKINWKAIKKEILSE